MKNRNKAIWSISTTNFRQLTPAYIATASFFAIGIYNLIVCLTGLTDNYYVDMANYLYVFAVIGPIIILTRNFKRVMSLNGRKPDFYFGCLLNYIISAAAISFIDIIMFVLAETAFGSTLIINNLVNVFSWWEHGAVIAFFQQFSFLLLLEIFIHTLTSIQTFWYGWVTDIILAAILIVFIPIPVLRSLLIQFFNLIIFNSNALLQIVCCLALSAVFYMLYLPILRRKEIK